MGAAERNTRRDGYMLLGFIALCLLTVAVILISTSRWNTEGSSALAAVAASVQALGVVVALVYAAGQHRETVRLRERQERPFVVVAFDVLSIPKLIFIDITNLGSVLARNVTLQFVPPLQAARPQVPGFDAADFVKQTFSTIVPGAHITTVFDFAPHRAERDGDPDFPEEYQVTVRCSDETGKCFKDAYTLDLRPYRTRTYIDRKTVHHVAKELKAIRGEIAKLVSK